MSNALLLTGKSSVTETAKFLGLMNKFFDCFNVTNPNSGIQKRNEYLDPWKKDDFRVKVATYMHYHAMRVNNLYTCTVAPKYLFEIFGFLGRVSNET